MTAKFVLTDYNPDACQTNQVSKVLTYAILCKGRHHVDPKGKLQAHSPFTHPSKIAHECMSSVYRLDHLKSFLCVAIGTKNLENMVSVDVD
eukprot:c28846_g2_i2 orf=42-314(-)